MQENPVPCVDSEHATSHSSPPSRLQCLTLSPLGPAVKELCCSSRQNESIYMLCHINWCKGTNILDKPAVHKTEAACCVPHSCKAMGTTLPIKQHHIQEVLNPYNESIKMYVWVSIWIDSVTMGNYYLLSVLQYLDTSCLLSVIQCLRRLAAYWVRFSIWGDLLLRECDSVSEHTCYLPSVIHCLMRLAAYWVWFNI